jgi:hypothetical protein
MAKDITEWTRQCIACQKAKIHNHVSPPPSVIPIPECRFSHIHVDPVGPLPPSQGCTHIFTMVDRTTRWAEAVPLSTTTAAACAEALCSAWICRFGIPHTITSDHGTQFTSSIWSQLSSFCTFLTSPQQLSILSPMEWWNGSIADSRTPCEHVALHPIGLLTCLSVSWLSVPPLMSCPTPHQRRLFLAHCWYCLKSFQRLQRMILLIFSPT